MPACSDTKRGRAADGLEQAGPAQFVGDGDRVGRLALAVQRVDGLEDVTVRRLVEVVGRTQFDRGGDGVARQEHRSEE